eukprot:gene9518-9683_t
MQQLKPDSPDTAATLLQWNTDLLYQQIPVPPAKSKRYSDWELCVLLMGYQTGKAARMTKKETYEALAAWLPGRTAEGVKQAMNSHIIGHEGKMMVRLKGLKLPASFPELLELWPDLEGLQAVYFMKGMPWWMMVFTGVQAQAQGHTAVLKVLLQQQLVNDVNAADDSGITALHLAAAAGHLEAVQALLEAGAKGWQHCAPGSCEKGSSGGNSTVSFRMDVQQAGVQQHSQEAVRTLLQLAVAAGSVEVVQLLLQGGADPDAMASTSSATPLHVAVAEGHSAVAEALLAAGAEPDALNTAGAAPVHLAAQKGLLPAVTAILNAGGDVNIKNSKGWGPVHVAASSGHLDVVLKLVAAGAAWRPGRGSSSSSPADADIVRLLVRKGSYKASYVEGRLRLAEVIMCDPVMAPDGHTYEREAIEDWLVVHRCSPVSGLPMAAAELVPNMTMRVMLAMYR